MASEITPDDLTMLFAGGKPLGLLDVREHGEYNTAHIAGSSSLPRRAIEGGARRLVPFAGTTLVVCDDDGRRAKLAATTLERIGFTDVRVLGGGLNRWTSEGFATEWGVNVPSKDFGERLLETEHVPEVSAPELHAWMNRGDDIVLLDTRTPEEHSAATIPGSRSMPGAELALRFGELAIGPNTHVVVHCAGRTRSIVGTKTLQLMGLPQTVALKNGTMGWMMAGYALEHGSQRTVLPEPGARAEREAAERAEALAMGAGVRFLDMPGLDEIMASGGSRNVYLVDVRTREEFEAGHVPGFRWFAGGQAVQRADEMMAVRAGEVVFCCDGMTRAAMTAGWFRRMGYPNVYAVVGGAHAWADAGRGLVTGADETAPWGYDEALAAVVVVSRTALMRQLASGTLKTIFVGASPQFARSHIPGASWVPRGWLEDRIASVACLTEAVAVTCVDGVQSTLAAATLRAMGYEDVRVLSGGMQEWSAAGLPVEQGLAGVMSPPHDVVLSGTERTWAEMMQYLAWEEELGRKYRSEPPRAV